MWIWFFSPTLPQSAWDLLKIKIQKQWGNYSMAWSAWSGIANGIKWVELSKLMREWNLAQLSLTTYGVMAWLWMVRIGKAWLSYVWIVQRCLYWKNNSSFLFLSFFFFFPSHYPKSSPLFYSFSSSFPVLSSFFLLLHAIGSKECIVTYTILQCLLFCPQQQIIWNSLSQGQRGST